MIVRLLKYGIKNILRNKFLSFSSILVLSLLMFFINILMIMHNLSSNLIENVNSKLTISLYLKDEYPKESSDTKILLSDISEKFPQILIDYKTKDEVLEEMRKKDEELVNIIKTENPLPATINLSNIKMEEYEGLNYLIESKLYILSDFRTNSNYDYRNQYDRIKNILLILNNLKLGLYVFIGIFLLSIFVITYSIIGNFVYHYRDEIYITKLVGGGNSFIYGPFVIQGIFYSLLGFVISANTFLILTKNIDFIFDRQQITNYILDSNLGFILIFQLFIFILIGGLSAYLSSRRYVNN